MGIKPRTEKKLAGYSSWYNRYQDITEDTIRELSLIHISP